MENKHVLLFTLIHAYVGAAVMRNESSLLLPANGRRQREQRSGGYPKFPSTYNVFEAHMSRDTHYTARECGTRFINFDPVNDLLRKGKIVGGTTVSFCIHLSFLNSIKFKQNVDSVCWKECANTNGN